MKKLFPFLLAACMVAACSKDGPLPGNARLCGDRWISCSGVKPGMYHCKIYRATDKKLEAERTCIFPSYRGTPAEKDVTDALVGYDGDTIRLKNGAKLIACAIPEDAERVQSVQGGAWVSCRAVDGQTNTYVCTVYHIRTGAVLSVGGYILKKHFWDTAANKMRYAKITGAAPVWECVYYGGIGIALNNKMVLMPVDWIDYPDSPRSGHRKQYDGEGNVIAQEEY